MKTNLEELEQIFHDINHSPIVPDQDGWYDFHTPTQRFRCKRRSWYWIVTAYPGLSKEEAVEFCRHHGKVVRALGYGRKGLTAAELEEHLSDEYHSLFGGYCREWHCDSLPGMQILIDKLTGVENDRGN